MRLGVNQRFWSRQSSHRWRSSFQAVCRRPLRFHSARKGFIHLFIRLWNAKDAVFVALKGDGAVMLAQQDRGYVATQIRIRPAYNQKSDNLHYVK